jgi:hypothetical protein
VITVLALQRGEVGVGLIKKRSHTRVSLSGLELLRVDDSDYVLCVELALAD